MINKNIKNNSTRLGEYKQKVVQEILSNPEITSAIDDSVSPAELLYNNIFPFSKIPGVIDVAKTYITIEVSMPRPSMVNNRFKDIIVTITIICHDDLMKTDYGMTRIDYLGILIEELFNNKANLGIGESEVVSNIEGVWTQAHSFREIRFKTKDYTTTHCGGD